MAYMDEAATAQFWGKVKKIEEKIDRVTLFNVTVPEDVSQVEFDFSSIDISRYTCIEFIIHSVPATTGTTGHCMAFRLAEEDISGHVYRLATAYGNSFSGSVSHGLGLATNCNANKSFISGIICGDENHSKCISHFITGANSGHGTAYGTYTGVGYKEISKLYLRNCNAQNTAYKDTDLVGAGTTIKLMGVLA